MPETRRYDKFYIILKEEITGYSFGDKKPNGNCSIEIRGDKGKATVYIQGLKSLTDGNMYKAYIISLCDKKAIGVSMGLIPVDAKGKGVKNWEFNPRNVGNSRIDIEKFNIIAIMVKNESNKTNDTIAVMCGYKNGEKLWKHIFQEFKETEDMLNDNKASLISEMSSSTEQPMLSKEVDLHIPIKESQENSTEMPVETSANLMSTEAPVLESAENSESSKINSVTNIESEKAPDTLKELPTTQANGYLQEQENVAMPISISLEYSESNKQQSVEQETVGQEQLSDPAVILPSENEELSNTKTSQETSAIIHSEELNSFQKEPSDKDQSKETDDNEQFKNLLSRYIKKTGNTQNIFNNANISANTENEDKATTPKNKAKNDDPHEAFNSLALSFIDEFKELMNYKLIDNEDVPVMQNHIFDDISYMLKYNPKMTPFEKQSSDTSWIRISLDELAVLPFKVWEFINNPFLVYAFTMYKHLILGCSTIKDTVKKTLGVPGIYDSALKLEASKIGFVQFKCCEDKNPVKGDAGYWLMDIL